MSYEYSFDGGQTWFYCEAGEPITVVGHQTLKVRCVGIETSRAVVPAEPSSVPERDMKVSKIKSVHSLAGKHAQPDHFRARQEFLEWNRAQPNPPIAIGKEYGVFAKIAELLEASSDVEIKQQKPEAWMVPVSGVYEYFATEAAARREREEYEREMSNDPDLEHVEPIPLFAVPFGQNFPPLMPQPSIDLPEGWQASHPVPWSALTPEAQRLNRITVTRIAAPFCDSKDNRVWSGPTLAVALKLGCDALFPGAAPDNKDKAK